MKIPFQGNSFDFRDYAMDHGVDEDPWPALGLHWRHH